MPLYFAYGSNMDTQAMRGRCPNARLLGRARLPRHRFFMMGSGHGSIKRDPRMDVHGLLYDLPFSDIPALDRYEEVGRGLYRKITQPVLREGAAAVRALIYVGASAQEGPVRGDYLARVVAAAKAAELPEPYIVFLQGLGGLLNAPEPGRRAIKLKGI